MNDEDTLRAMGHVVRGAGDGTVTPEHDAA
jgi:hypothetical protein